MAGQSWCIEGLSCLKRKACGKTPSHYFVPLLKGNLAILSQKVIEKNACRYDYWFGHDKSFFKVMVIYLHDTKENVIFRTKCCQRRIDQFY